MKNTFLVFAVLLGLTTTHLKAEGVVAVCEVAFNNAGHASAKMVKSTGSTTLDQYLVEHAGDIWPGAPGMTFSMPVNCQEIEVSTPHGKAKIKIAAPQPPYPLQARIQRVQGDGALTISFGKDGRPTGVKMSKSSGSEILDSNAERFAFAKWRSEGGFKVTTTMNMKYHLY